MKYLLDTNIVSEFSRKIPATEVVSYLEKLEHRDIAISVMTVFEIRIGALQHKDEIRRRKLLAWAEAVQSQFQARILPFDLDATRILADIRDQTFRSGFHIELTDLIIAATGIHRGLTVVTRNVRHFEPTGVAIVNPWDLTTT